jgi:hypothetical protein
VQVADQLKGRDEKNVEPPKTERVEVGRRAQTRGDDGQRDATVRSVELGGRGFSAQTTQL